jgi:hypothetical protein
VGQVHRAETRRLRGELTEAEDAEHVVADMAKGDA